MSTPTTTPPDLMDGEGDRWMWCDVVPPLLVPTVGRDGVNTQPITLPARTQTGRKSGSVGHSLAECPVPERHDQRTGPR